MSDEGASILAYLASRLTSQTEVLATEALGYILSRSTASRRALHQLVHRTDGQAGPSYTQVQTEVAGEDNERVDLVAFDESGTERLLIEAKFWAGLTDNQPNTYIKRLRKGGDPSVLLFVAPRTRIETLWPKLLEIGRKEYDLQEEDHTASDMKSAAIDGSSRRLSLTSWRSLLDTLTAEARLAGDVVAEQDIRQLSALCERQDAEAFLPLRPQEFALDIPRRLLNLQLLIDDATMRAKEAGIVDTSGLIVTPRATGYGRYLRIGREGHAWAQARFEVNYRYWIERQETPLFFSLFGSDDMSSDEIEKRLGYSWFGFDLPVGVEYEEVLDHVLSDLHEVADGICGEALPRN